MARTQIPLTVIGPNIATADVVGTSIDATNSHYIDLGAYEAEQIVLRITNTTASTKTATVKKGVDPPADANGADLVVSLTDGSGTPTVAFAGPFTSARFMQAGSQLNIDIAAGMTGKIAAFAIPRTA